MTHKARVALIVLGLSWISTGYATQNQLNLELNTQQTGSSNFLLSESNPEYLYGLQTQPTINYLFDDGISTYGINFRHSLERYNRQDFNGSFPQLALSFKERTERGSWGMNISGNQQSTRTTEFKDSGLLERTASRRDESSLQGNWNYSFSERNSLLINISLGAVNYQSNSYADLKNDSLQLIEQYQWSERLSIYAGASLLEYASKYSSYFPIIPLAIESNLLCPPNSRLFNENACYRFKSELGDAKNLTRSEGFRAGLKYSLNEIFSANLDFGNSLSKTKQQITQAKIPVFFGSPINKELIFGGENENRSDSKTTTANVDINYAGNLWGWKLSGSQQLLPSSAGTLRKSQSIGLDANFKQSEVTSWTMSIEAQDSSSLDTQVISNVNNDRIIIQSQLGMSRQWSKKLSSTFSLAYQKQKIKGDIPYKAQAWSSQLTLVYRPQAWAW